TPATTAIYTLSLHDALPIFSAAWSSISRIEIKGMVVGSVLIQRKSAAAAAAAPSIYLRIASTTPQNAGFAKRRRAGRQGSAASRSEEHTSELQSRENLVCRL